MSEKSKGDTSRVVKNPLLSASVTGLTFEDFPNKPLLLPAAPPVVTVPTVTTSVSDEPQQTVTVGQKPDIDTETFSEISLNSVTEEEQGEQVDNPQGGENTDESILSQAASSFSQLPTVASTVFSTFSKVIKDYTPTREGSSERESLQNETDLQQSVPYVVPTPFVASDPINSQESEPIPEPPRLYSPSDICFTSPFSTHPPSSGIQNNYRLTAKKKTYAQIPGLSLHSPNQPHIANPLEVKNFPPSLIKSPEAVGVPTSTVPQAGGQTYQEKPEERKSLFSLSNFVPPVWQNLTGLVQSAEKPEIKKPQEYDYLNSNVNLEPASTNNQIFGNQSANPYIVPGFSPLPIDTQNSVPAPPVQILENTTPQVRSNQELGQSTSDNNLDSNSNANFINKSNTVLDSSLSPPSATYFGNQPTIQAPPKPPAGTISGCNFRLQKGTRHYKSALNPSPQYTQPVNSAIVNRESYPQQIFGTQFQDGSNTVLQPKIFDPTKVDYSVGDQAGVNPTVIQNLQSSTPPISYYQHKSATASEVKNDNIIVKSESVSPYQRVSVYAPDSSVTQPETSGNIEKIDANSFKREFRPKIFDPTSVDCFAPSKPASGEIIVSRRQYHSTLAEIKTNTPQQSVEELGGNIIVKGDSVSSYKSVPTLTSNTDIVQPVNIDNKETSNKDQLNIELQSKLLDPIPANNFPLNQGTIKQPVESVPISTQTLPKIPITYTQQEVSLEKNKSDVGYPLQGNLFLSQAIDNTGQILSTKRGDKGILSTTGSELEDRRKEIFPLSCQLETSPAQTEFHSPTYPESNIQHPSHNLEGFVDSIRGSDKEHIKKESVPSPLGRSDSSAPEIVQGNVFTFLDITTPLKVESGSPLAEIPNLGIYQQSELNNIIPTAPPAPVELSEKSNEQFNQQNYSVPTFNLSNYFDTNTNDVNYNQPQSALPPCTAQSDQNLNKIVDNVNVIEATPKSWEENRSNNNNKASNVVNYFDNKTGKSVQEDKLNINVATPAFVPDPLAFFDSFNQTNSTQTAATITEDPNSLRIQDFFNNPPQNLNDSSSDLNYKLVGSGVVDKRLENLSISAANDSRTLSPASNLVEPPSSSCSEFSSEFTSQFVGNLSTLTPDDLPDELLEEFKMSGLLGNSSGQVNAAYVPVTRHWFYKKENNGKQLWTPFSYVDSNLLEEHFLLGNEGKKIVAVEGDRFDVNIPERTRTPVYWSGEPTEVRRCSWFYKAVDSKYIPYEEDIAELLEEEYKEATVSGEWHRKIALPTGETVVFHGPTVMVHFLQSPPTTDTWAGSSQTTARPRVVKRDIHDFTIEAGESKKVDYLMFMVHGVGSACDLKFRPVEEVVDEFRSIALQLVSSHYKNSCESGLVGRVEVLPVSWHSQLHSGESGIDEKLKAITLSSIPKLRNFTNDTLLDVLFYTSPMFCQNIQDTVAGAMNKIYLKYCQRNPEFRGGVSLAGHSLGSLILFDLLCHQKPLEEGDIQNSENPDQIIQPRQHSSYDVTISKQVSYTMGAAGTGQPFINYPQLIFHPKMFFALGSPIGMFVTIRGIDALGLDFKLPTCSGFYNIFHPYDPVAYRIEALVNPDLSSVRPVLIPHHKGRKRMHLELKETMTRVGTDLKQKIVDTFKSTLGSVYFLQSKDKSDPQEIEKEVDKVLEMQLNLDQSTSRSRTNSNSTQSDGDSGEVDLPLGKLNSSRRIDYVLQEAPLEFFNEYLFALSSHVCYWESEDTILFIMKEIYSSLGINTDSQIPQQSMTIERPNSGSNYNLSPK